jgi:hypothetical protein
VTAVLRPIQDAFPVKVKGDESVVLETVPYSPYYSAFVGEPAPKLRWVDTNVIQVRKTIEGEGVDRQLVLTDVVTGDRYKPVDVGGDVLVEPLDE